MTVAPFGLDLQQLPDELRQRVEGELAPDEWIRWVGQPRARRQIWDTLLLTLFGIPLILMSMLIVVGPEGNVSRTLALLPFLAGLGVLCTPLWAIRRSRRTVYLLTDRRAVILRVETRLLVQSFAPTSLQRVQCRAFRSGYGDLLFRLGDAASGYTETSSAEIPGFRSIRDVRRVESVVRRLARGDEKQAEASAAKADPRSSLPTHRLASLPDPLRARVQAELQHGERVVWIGQPTASRRVGRLRPARHTAYLITDRRALTVRAAYPAETVSFPPEFLDRLERHQRRDGSGDLAFYVGQTENRPDFQALRDVQAVERLLRATLLTP